MSARDDTPAAELVARLLHAAFVPLPPFTIFELAGARAGSPLQELLATPAFLALDDQRLRRELHVALDRLLEDHFLVETDATLRGSPRALVTPRGALDIVVRAREDPTLVTVVTVVRRSSFAEPLGETGDARLLAALFGLRLEPENRLAVLEEVVGPDGVHYFLLATLEAEADRIRRGFLRMTASLASDESSHSSTPGTVGLVVDSFRPKFANPARQRLLITRAGSDPEADEPGLLLRWSRHGDGWGRPDGDVVDGARWTDAFVTSLAEVAG